MTHILTVLNKTSPPVLIFAEKKQDVDLIQEYLLLKGVTAAAIHGGKDQEERSAAIVAFQVNFVMESKIFIKSTNQKL